MKNSTLWKSKLIAAAIGLLAGMAGCDQSGNKPTERPLPSVVVFEVKQQAVPIVMNVAGTVQPIKTVKIVPRVSGYIFERNFTEGSNVTKGDPLYLIDPRPYQSQLDMLKAKLEQDMARLKFASAEADRYDRLGRTGNVSQEDKDKVDANKAEVLASIDADKADIENAQLNLTFTRITAPFSGRIEETQAHVGDLVQKEQSVLTTVVQIDPIYVVSNISREQVYQIQKLQEQGLAPSALEEFTAELTMPDGAQYPHIGKFNYISALIDTATDATQVRFEFANPNEGSYRALIPGQYIPLRMIVGHRTDALLIPEKVVQQTQEGTYVLVVDKDNKVEKRLVTTGASHENMLVVEKGLSKGERVISEGLQKVRPGMTVTTTDATTRKSPA